MPDPVTVTRKDGPTLVHDEHGLALRAHDEVGPEVNLSPDDLHWLVTTGGPAMIALLGGPIEGRGIARTDGRS